jgi:hypothetical protein
MSETFQFDVSYSTTFPQLETLREKMLEFVKAERRDYQPAFDVVVVGMCFHGLFLRLSLSQQWVARFS